MIFGRRAFFGHATAPDRTVWWFVNVPMRPEPDPATLRAVSSTAWRARLETLSAGDAGPAREIVAATPDFPAMTAIHTMPRLTTWHRGPLVITGDAAHAPSPTSGQGASLSIEDGLVLAQCLRDISDTTTALATFEALRRPRVERIVAAAARINNTKAAGPVARVLRDAMLPLFLRRTINSKADAATFDHHIDWEERISPVAGTTRRSTDAGSGSRWDA